MKFNSQICTTKEQSKRLLALGLKVETADCCWAEALTLTHKKSVQWFLMAENFNKCDEKHIPAWSLHRLIEIAKLSHYWQCLSGDWYNEVIAEIQSKIHIGELNKEYLEERV